LAVTLRRRGFGGGTPSFSSFAVETVESGRKVVHECLDTVYEGEEAVCSLPGNGLYGESEIKVEVSLDAGSGGAGAEYDGFVPAAGSAMTVNTCLLSRSFCTRESSESVMACEFFLLRGNSSDVWFADFSGGEAFGSEGESSFEATFAYVSAGIAGFAGVVARSRWHARSLKMRLEIDRSRAGTRRGAFPER